jgi:hypothetical protein
MLTTRRARVTVCAILRIGVVVIGLLNLLDGKAVLPYVEYGAGACVFLFVLVDRLNKSLAGSILKEPGLYGVTGRMGRGKSYLLALAIWWARRGSRIVFANFEVVGCVSFKEWDDEHRDNDQWHGSVLFENWTQLRTAPNGAMCVLDEAQIWWASTDHAAPVEVRQWVTQLRKRKLTVLWATQDISFVARWLRILSFGIWECKKFKSGHQYTLVDPIEAGKTGKQMTMARFRVKRKKRVMALYDTNALVASSREWGASTLD